jgi:hypothetical protein
MKSKKSKKSKGKGKKSKKSPTVASTVMDGNDDVLMEVPVASKTKKRVSGKKKSTHETGASASEPAACPKPKAARRKRRASKAVSDPPPAAPHGPSEVDRIDLECPPGGHVEPKVDKGAGLDSGEHGAGEKPLRPDDAIDAPSHLTLNAVYSSAYRKAKAATGSADAARVVA